MRVHGIKSVLGFIVLGLLIRCEILNLEYTFLDLLKIKQEPVASFLEG